MAHETSTAFSDEVMKEHAVFELNKAAEMKEMMQSYADGQVEMLQNAMDDWDKVSRTYSQRRSRCLTFARSFLSCNEYGSTFEGGKWMR